MKDLTQAYSIQAAIQNSMNYEKKSSWIYDGFY